MSVDAPTLRRSDSSLISRYLDGVLRSKNTPSYVDATFEFIGENFKCDRVYIFEVTPRDTFSNTYEWCAEGIEPQMEMLQEEPLESIRWWIELFENDMPVVIEDLETLRLQHPRAYAALKPQGIDSLITCALRSEEQFIGFIGVDNPQLDEKDEIVDFMTTINPYVVSFLHRDQASKKLHYTCYHDLKTGALNVQSWYAFDREIASLQSLGIIHLDISGVKRINEYVGRRAGDEAIIKCYRLLREVFPFDKIFRVCGVKFVIACENFTEEEFQSKIVLLRQHIKRHDQHISIGSDWSNAQPIDIEILLTHAESNTYNDKYKFIGNRNQIETSPILKYADDEESGSDFELYARHNYFNSEVLVDTITDANRFNNLFFGDLQTSQFFISNNMKEDFGFESNIVPNLFTEWESRITNSDDLALYRSDIADIIYRKKSVHDLRYRVKDVNGIEMWIHCKGKVHWNPAKTMPLFFSGNIVRQDADIVIDPITKFQKESAAKLKLTGYGAEGLKVRVIGFALNNFTQINELRGRHVGDRLISDIATRLQENFEGMIAFYRLDGLRFLAICNPEFDVNTDSLVDDIREIISSQYRAHTVMVKNPCAVSVMLTNPEESLPHEILSNTISMLALAKNAPEKNYVTHSAEGLEEQHRQAEMIFELTENVENEFENFRIVIQPTVCALSKKIKGGEVLLRWKFNGTPVSPDVFIPILEKNRLIHSVGRWVFEQVVRAAKRALVMNPDLYIAFNVSYLQIMDPGFFPHMKHVLKTYDLDASKLVLELTETHFDDAPQKLQAFFDSCEKLGIRVALDDFGNGYSSLGLLLKYPTHIVKLDRTILNSMSDSEANQKFIRSIVFACHAFGKEVCAEGVETEEELNVTQSALCDYIQGYYFSKPLELGEFYGLIAERDSF